MWVHGAGGVGARSCVAGWTGRGGVGSAGPGAAGACWAGTAGSGVVRPRVRRRADDRRPARPGPQPRSPANLDHVLVGPAGVFVIDAKNWTCGRLRLDERGMAVGKWRKDDELHSAKVDADIVREHVDGLGERAGTAAVVAFVHDMGLSAPVQHRGVVLLQREQLLPWLTALPSRLGPDQVSYLAAALDVEFRRGCCPRPQARSLQLARCVRSRPAPGSAAAGPHLLCRPRPWRRHPSELRPPRSARRTGNGTRPAGRSRACWSGSRLWCRPAVRAVDHHRCRRCRGPDHHQPPGAHHHQTDRAGRLHQAACNRPTPMTGAASSWPHQVDFAEVDRATASTSV